MRSHLDHTISRRDFLAGTAALALGSAFGLPAMAAPKPKKLIGSNIYGWSQYYGREGKNVGDHVGEVLSILHDLGYDYLEPSLDIAHPENLVRFAEQSRARGMQAVCFYTGGNLHTAEKADQEVDRILAAAKLVQPAGYKVVDCNPNPIGREKTTEELKTQAKSLERFGQGLRELGMRLAVHNHTPEMANNGREYHYNFAKTTPKNVGFCYDVHWVYRGGIGPAEVLKQYGDRIASLHLRQGRGGVWWEDLDSGDVDYSVIVDYLRKHEMNPLLTVELAIEKETKITRTGVENHRRSIEWVRKTFGA